MVVHVAFNNAESEGLVYPAGHPEIQLASFTLAIPERKLWRFRTQTSDDSLPLLASTLEQAVERFLIYTGTMGAELEVEFV